MQNTNHPNPVRESRIVGHELALALSRGVQPYAIDVRMALQQGEFCVGQTPVLLLAFHGCRGWLCKKTADMSRALRLAAWSLEQCIMRLG